MVNLFESAPLIRSPSGFAANKLAFVMNELSMGFRMVRLLDSVPLMGPRTGFSAVKLASGLNESYEETWLCAQDYSRTAIFHPEELGRVRELESY
jgi:hypothetical protein